MSTRYVWEKSSAQISVSFQIIEGNSNALFTYSSDSWECYLCTAYTTGFFEETETVKYFPSGNYIKLSSSNAGQTYLSSSYQYAILTRNNIYSSNIMKPVSGQNSILIRRR